LVGEWVLETVRPEWAGLGLFGLAAALFLWLRPRLREVIPDDGTGS